MGSILKSIEQWIGGGPGGPGRIRAFRWLLLLGLAGVLAMLISSYMSVKDIGPAETGQALREDLPKHEETFLGSGSENSDPIRDMEAAYEQRLKNILENIVGVGVVDVLVSLESTEEIIVARSEHDTQSVTDETDGDGGRRHITELSRNGEIVLHEVSGEQSPIISKTLKPKVRGVLVVAKGAENMTVKKLLIEAVERGLDVSSHNISVVPRKQ